MTGDPNAKYFVTHLLASTIGAAAEKALYPITATADGNASAATAILYALPFRFTFVGGAKGVLLVNKKAAAVNVTLRGVTAGTASVVEVAPAFAGGAGFQPPVQRPLSAAGDIELGPFAVAVLLDMSFVKPGALQP